MNVPAVDALVGLARMRNQLLRAETKLTLQIKAIARTLARAAAPMSAIDEALPSMKVPTTLDSLDLDDGLQNVGVLTTRAARDRAVDIDASFSLEVLAAFASQPLQECRDHVRRHRMQLEKRLVAHARQLPVWPWVEGVRGFGPLGFGLLIGETGDLWNYANPGKVWKRLGLAVFDGRAQRRVAGDSEEAIRQGYSPHRRSLMHVLGDALIKQNKDGPFRVVYLQRKAYELERAPEMKPIVAHKRAMRYMEKRLVRELWRAWRSVEVTLVEARI